MCAQRLRYGKICVASSFEHDTRHKIHIMTTLDTLCTESCPIVACATAAACYKLHWMLLGCTGGQ